MAEHKRKRAVAVQAPTRVPEIAHLEDIISTIFTKLPVTSLHSCKQVVKQWYEIITKPHFTRLHFTSNLQNEKLVLHLIPRNAKHSLALHLVDKDAQISSYTTLRRLGYKVDLHIIASFNGLMCCNTWTLHGLRTFIINPATRKILRIPNGRKTVVAPTFGVVFDLEPAKYKIVCFSSMRWFDPSNTAYNCEVYCPEREAWSLAGFVLPRPIRTVAYPFLPPQLCVGGRMYWFVWNMPEGKLDHILSIGMDEVVRRVELPVKVDEDDGSVLSFGGHTFLINYRGSLGIFYLEKDDGLAGIYSLVDPNASEWRFVGFTIFEEFGPLKGINSIVEIGNELLFVMKLNSDGYFHFRFLNLDTMRWREAQTGFLKRRVFKPQPLLHENCEALVFPFRESAFKCKGE